jgi:hypothetical protein
MSLIRIMNAHLATEPESDVVSLSTEGDLNEKRNLIEIVNTDESIATRLSSNNHEEKEVEEEEEAVTSKKNENTILKEDSDSPATCSKTTNQTTALKNKRNYLEVSSIEKYKNFVIKPLETKKFKPSDTLDKVRQFLPLLRESTNKLLEENKNNLDDLNIENVDEEDEHIEMNLAVVSDSGSDSDEDEYDEGEDDDENNDDDEVEEEDSVSSGNENSASGDGEDDKLVDEINLGFKVKDTTKLTKLKTSIEEGKKSKKILIKMIENTGVKSKELAQEENLHDASDDQDV